MSALVLGVISRSMCARARPPDCTLISEIGPGIKQQQAVVIRGTTPTMEESSVHFMSRAYTSKSIKHILIKEIAMTLQDLQIFESIPIPDGFVVSLLFPLEKCTVNLSVLPTLTLAGPLVPWTTYAAAQYHVFAVDQAVAFPDFLMAHARLNGAEGPIHYHLFVHQKPLLFGKAVARRADASEFAFLFGRLICCKEMALLRSWQ
jgi:hypothetical protein